MNALPAKVDSGLADRGGEGLAKAIAELTELSLEQMLVGLKRFARDLTADGRVARAWRLDAAEDSSC